MLKQWFQKLFPSEEPPPVQVEPEPQLQPDEVEIVEFLERNLKDNPGLWYEGEKPVADCLLYKRFQSELSLVELSSGFGSRIISIDGPAKMNLSEAAQKRLWEALSWRRYFLSDRRRTKNVATVLEAVRELKGRSELVLLARVGLRLAGGAGDRRMDRRRPGEELSALGGRQEISGDMEADRVEA